ncbi:MAG TPA: formyltransferase family protein [Xanthobacteraceae bacterium]|nr:formyltransferase family protein [Xanthobacteraceae bacterium]
MSHSTNAVAVLARTRWGIEAARCLAQSDIPIRLVATARAESFYNCGEAEYAELARDTGAMFVNVSTTSSDDLSAAIRECKCALAISVNWPTVLNSEFIGHFSLGILNAHAGDLPRYRGNACPNWAILNGESRIGLCVHFMEPDALDSGPVVLRDGLCIGAKTYIGDVYDWLDQCIPKLLREAVLGVLRKTVTPIPQQNEQSLALRCYPRRPEDGRIDWNAPAEIVHRLIRATSHPFAGAFAFLENGRRVTIWRASVFNHPGSFCAVPGQFMARVGGCPVVACGEGCLLIEDVTVDGGDRQNDLSDLSKSLRARLI